VLTLRGRWHARWAERNNAAGCQAWRIYFRCCHNRSEPRVLPSRLCSGRRQPAAARRGAGAVTFLVEQRPEKTMAQRCLDLRLRPKEWPFGERMGSSKGCAVSEMQVSVVSQRPAVFRGYVRIYASDRCPRQDSNLRSRLRSRFLGTALTSGNVLAGVPAGHVSGTTRRRPAVQASSRLSSHAARSTPRLRRGAQHRLRYGRQPGSRGSRPAPC
jgi:hypothetical protein